MSDTTKFDRAVNRARDIAIQGCTDYLAMSQARFFSDFGRYDAATKRKYFEEVRTAARTEQNVQKFREILLEALRFLNDGSPKTALRRSLEVLDSALRDYAVTVFSNKPKPWYV